MIGAVTQRDSTLDAASLQMYTVRMHVWLQVGHPVRRTLRLVNQSDGLLRYALECSAADGSGACPGLGGRGVPRPLVTGATLLGGAPTPWAVHVGPAQAQTRPSLAAGWGRRKGRGLLHAASPTAQPKRNAYQQLSGKPVIIN
jgi:hypothetical protein